VSRRDPSLRNRMLEECQTRAFGAHKPCNCSLNSDVADAGAHAPPTRRRLRWQNGILCSGGMVCRAMTERLSGRRAQAARNDQIILEAARAVFIADPGAPISEVAKRAGVGISALYSRYASKEDLLRKLCQDGLQRVVEETEVALADDRDAWTVFSEHMARLVDADTSSLTLALAGRFTPTPEMFELAERANELGNRLFERTRGVLRDGLEVHDLSLVFELIAAIKLLDGARTKQLRRRYLAVVLDGLRAGSQEALPGPAPSWQEINERWVA
jgi:AcrR family transcriptional regulator